MIKENNNLIYNFMGMRVQIVEWGYKIMKQLNQAQSSNNNRWV